MLLLGQWTQFWALVVVFAADRIVARGMGDLSPPDLASIIAGSAALVVATIAAAAVIRSRRATEAAAVFLKILPGQRGRTTAELRAVAASWHDDIQRLLGPASAAIHLGLAKPAAGEAGTGTGFGPTEPPRPARPS